MSEYPYTRDEWWLMVDVIKRSKPFIASDMRYGAAATPDPPRESKFTRASGDAPVS